MCDPVFPPVRRSGPTTTTISGAAMPTLPTCCGTRERLVDPAAGTNANGCKGSDKGSDERETWAVSPDLSTNPADGRGLVPHTGC
jgi:hypothetical protein